MNWLPLPLSPTEYVGAVSIGAYVALFARKARAAFAYTRAESAALRDKTARQVGRQTGRYDLTVLQPILSGDPTLEECLRENLTRADRGTQFVWLVDANDAEAVRVAEKLDRPGVTITPCPPAPPGVNPKVDKLERALATVATEYVAVLDDDTTVGTEHMGRAVAVLRSPTGAGGLYTGLPTYRAEPASIGGSLVAGFVNSSSALTYLPTAHAGPPITLNGMFYVTRSDDLRALGGFTVIRDELCDDLAMAELFRGDDRPIHQGSMAQQLLTGPMGLGAYVSRMHRWFVFASVLYRRQDRGTRARLVLNLGAPPVLLWTGLAFALTSKPLAILFAALLVGRLWTLSALLSATCEPGRGDNSPAVFPISSTVAELLLPLHALHAALLPTIRWRTRRMQVQRDGTFRSLPNK